MLGFLHVQLPQHELLPSWASSVLGLLLSGAELGLLPSGYIRVMAQDMSGEYIVSSVLVLCNKDLK